MSSMIITGQQSLGNRFANHDPIPSENSRAADPALYHGKASRTAVVQKQFHHVLEPQQSIQLKN